MRKLPMKPAIAMKNATELSIPATKIAVTTTLLRRLSADCRLFIKNNGRRGNKQGEIAMNRPDPNTPVSFTKSKPSSITPCTPQISCYTIDAMMSEMLGDAQSPTWKYLKNPSPSIKTIEGTDDTLK